MRLDPSRAPSPRWPRRPLVAARLPWALALAACSLEERAQPAPLPGPVVFDAGLAVDGEALPLDSTCLGAGRSPELRWSGAPPTAQDLLLVVRSGAGVLHWAAWGISPAPGALPAGTPSTQAPPLQGRNDGGVIGWLPPCAPPAAPSERMVFELYALGAPLLAPPTAPLESLMSRAAPLIVGVARFERAAFAPAPQSPQALIDD